MTDLDINRDLSLDDEIIEACEWPNWHRFASPVYKSAPKEAQELWEKIDRSLDVLVDFQPWDVEWGLAFDAVEPQITELTRMGYGYQLDQPMLKMGRKTI